jgi:DNA-directed RNA polymerase specialized sigma24 family protein
VQTLWNGLIDHLATPDPSATAPSHEATVDRLEAMIPGLLDPFSQFRRGILVSLLLGLSIQQTAERHRCTQRTVHATLQTALELLDTPGVG